MRGEQQVKSRLNSFKLSSESDQDENGSWDEKVSASISTYGISRFLSNSTISLTSGAVNNTIKSTQVATSLLVAKTAHLNAFKKLLKENV